MLLTSRHTMLRLKILAPKLVDLKTALVNIEMDIALLKIRCTGLPDNCFGVECFYCQPCAIADDFAMLIWQGKKNFQFVVMRLLVDLQDYTANIFAIHNNAVGFVFRIVNAALDGITGDDFSIIIKKMKPVRSVSFTRADRTAMGHTQTVRYIAEIVV